MRNIIIAIVVLALIGGGVYVFSKNEAIAPEQNNTQNSNTSTENADTQTGVVVNVEPLTPTTQSSATTKTFIVNGSSFAFDPKTIEVNKGDKVKIIFKNTGGKHDWKIDEFNATTKIINGGEEDIVEFIADKTGSFEYYCSVGSHRAMGMKGTLVVK
ncbi:MAG: plastocyanin/azurin family copper-binding protein [Patescibacteria group bacterium]